MFFFFVDVGPQALFKDKIFCAEGCSPICSAPGATSAPLRTPLAVATPAHRGATASLFSSQKSYKNLGAVAMESDSSSDS
eukprot:1560200-Pleurochrysis_carterae.AAC.4